MTPAERVLALRGCSAVGKATAETLAELATRVTERRVAPGDVLFARGDEPEHLHVVLDGMVELVRESSGRSRWVGAGELAGEIAVCDRAPYAATAVVREPGTVIAIPTGAVEDLLDSSPGVTRELLRRLAAAHGPSRAGSPPPTMRWHRSSIDSPRPGADRRGPIPAGPPAPPGRGDRGAGQRGGGRPAHRLRPGRRRCGRPGHPRPPDRSPSRRCAVRPTVSSVRCPVPEQQRQPPPCPRSRRWSWSAASSPTRCSASTARSTCSTRWPQRSPRPPTAPRWPSGRWPRRSGWCPRTRRRSWCWTARHPSRPPRPVLPPRSPVTSNGPASAPTPTGPGPYSWPRSPRAISPRAPSSCAVTSAASP